MIVYLYHKEIKKNCHKVANPQRKKTVLNLSPNIIAFKTTVKLVSLRLRGKKN